MTAVAVFAMNIFGTLLHPPPIPALKFIPYLPHEVPLEFLSISSRKKAKPGMLSI